VLSGTLGLARWHLVGHDWGGPVAFALAAAHPEAIRTLTIVDVTLPGIGPDISQGGKRWHHAFHMTPDLPEALVQGRERAYLSWFYEAFSWQRGVFAAADIDEYLRTYTQPGALRAGFAFYRNIPNDIADNRALLASGLRLKMPVLAVGGGREEARGRGSEPEALVEDDRRRRHGRDRRRQRPLRSRGAARGTGGAAAAPLRESLIAPPRTRPGGTGARRVPSAAASAERGRAAKRARAPSRSSTRTASFHFAMRSPRANDPTLSWPELQPTAR
jgi:hypothetical protein